MLHFVCKTLTFIQEEYLMPTSQARLSAIVEQPLYDLVAILADKDHVSLSQKVRDLLLQSLELTEDAVLEEIIHQRKKVSRKGYSLNQIKKKLDLT